MWGPEVTWLLGVCTSIVTIDRVVDIIIKIKTRSETPVSNLEARLALIEKHLEEVDRYLAQDKMRLDEYGEGSRTTQRALLALLANAIDGNNVDQLKKAKEELEGFLINRYNTL